MATAARMFFPAGDYHHPPTGIVQLRVIRGGSSYAEIDLGAGLRRVFTRPGDLLLSLPHRATRFKIEEPRELTMITVDPSLARELLMSAGGTIDELDILDRPMRDPLVAELCRRLESDPPANGVVREWALGLIFANLLRLGRAYRRRQKPNVLTSARFDRVLAAIDAELEGKLSVDRLAELSGMPRRAFTAAFREAAGLPVHQFVLRRRVDRAVQLLENSDLPLAEIAHLTGFTHQAHMNRVVSRLKGLSPGRLRSRGRDEEP
ncbi:helix-turn-helix domain-containing protein [Mesorhizobium kowhaii]|uniref:helix-turn-helix domain-containing protein n=1 Tax=Mesorhizobium kowhaii TaxID=1300272 RepID=UPI00363AB47B